MRIIFTFLLFTFLHFSHEAQVVTFDFGGIAGDETIVVSNSNASYVTTSSITRGSGVSAAANADRINSTGWTTAASLDVNDYYEFTITPTPGCNFSITSIQMYHQRSGTGPRTFELRSNLDGYATTLGLPVTIPDVTSTQNSTFTFSVGPSTSAITFRIYGYSAEGAAGSWGIGDNSGNDLIVNGSGACAGCSITNEGLVVGECNDNGTPGDRTDDYYSISINPTGIDLSATYSYSGSYTGSGIAYGSAHTITTNVLISDGAKTITIEDDDPGSSCSRTFTVNPPSTCSVDDVPGGIMNLQAQFVNPCGNDGQNEFITFSIGSTPLSIHDIAYGNTDHTTGTQPNFNYWWHGNNVPAETYPTFTPNTEICGGSGSGQHPCYGFDYPSLVPTEYSDFVNVLNTVAGCAVFLAPPSTDLLPADANVILFLSGGECPLDNPTTNLNFSNHCSAGTPVQQYYVVLGTANSGCGSSGFLSNADPRTSYLYGYDGTGPYNDIANYFADELQYTPTTPPAGNAGVALENGNFVTNGGCVPTPQTIILPVNLIYFNAIKSGNSNLIQWKVADIKAFSHFELEKSTDGKNFTTINRSYLNSTNTSIFEYEDKALDVVSNLIYYRLKMIDLDGSFNVSKTISVQHRINLNMSYAYASSTLQVHTSGKTGTLSVYSINGNLVKSYSLESKNQSFELSDLPQGIYVATLRSGDEYRQLKLVR